MDLELEKNNLLEKIDKKIKDIREREKDLKDLFIGLDVFYLIFAIFSIGYGVTIKDSDRITFLVLVSVITVAFIVGSIISYRNQKKDMIAENNERIIKLQKFKDYIINKPLEELVKVYSDDNGVNGTIKVYGNDYILPTDENYSVFPYDKLYTNEYFAILENYKPISLK